MRDILLFVRLALLVLLSICLLVESENDVRQCETLLETTEHCQGTEEDAYLQNSLKKWRIQRAETVKTLKDIRDKLDMLTVSANYGKGAGNGAQLVGTFTSIAGSLMELAGLPSFKSFMGIGDLIYHSGSLVDGVSTVTESLGSAKYLNDAGNVLKKDKELSASLGNSLQNWNSLNVKVQEIFGLDLSSEKYVQFGNFLHEFSRVKFVIKDFKKTVDHMKSGKYSTYIETEIRLDRLLKLSKYLERNPQIPTEIRMGLIGFNRVAALVQSCRELVGNDFSYKMASVVQKYEVPTVNTVAQYTFLRSIDVAVNYLSLLDVAKVIKEGKSKYSDSLKGIIDLLELELKNTELL